MSAVFDTVEEFWSWDDIEIAAQRVNKNSAQHFKLALADYLGVHTQTTIELVPSARFGLEKLLQDQLGERRSVLVPCFNCSVVQESILAAGGITQLYDFSPSPGLFNWEKVIQQADSNTGAIIVTHYFGVPIDLRPIIDYCRTNEILLIEDCAHTLGGKIGSAVAGTLGDVALFSFNHDKPMSLAWGGAILVNNATFSKNNWKEKISVPSVDQELTMLNDFCRAMTARRTAIPKQFRLSEKIFRKLGLRPSSTFGIKPDMGMGQVQAQLGIQCLSRYDAILSSRKKNAERLATNCPGRTWPVGADITPAWLKQKVRFSSIANLTSQAKQFQTQGLRAGNFNWPALLEGVERHHFENSLNVAELWMDVPIHQNIDERHIETFSSSINSMG